MQIYEKGGHKCCPRCGMAVPHHRPSCTVPKELDMMERVHRRLRARGERTDLSSRIEHYLAWFQRA